MSIAKLTLIGTYNYDNTLFDNLSFENVDHETMVNTILMNCGEFEVLYPNIETLKDMFTLFSKKWSRTVEKWVIALNTEYNPLENYDRYEKYMGNEVETEHGNESYTNNGNTVLSRSGSDDNNSENKTSAFNSVDYQPNEQTINKMTYGSFDRNDVNLSQTRTPNLKKTRTPNLENHIHGNVGVTTSQQMLESELKLQYWNLYDKISNIFMKEFCIMCY